MIFSFLGQITDLIVLLPYSKLNYILGNVTLIHTLNPVFSEPYCQKMNCKQLNSVKLEEVLRALGHPPTRKNTQGIVSQPFWG